MPEKREIGVKGLKHFYVVGINEIRRYYLWFSLHNIIILINFKKQMSYISVAFSLTKHKTNEHW